MRLWIMLLVTAAGLPGQIAQTPVSDKLELFKRNLANALRPHGAIPALRLEPRPQPKVCSIPLLVVGPDRSFKSNMPLIPPDSKAAFTAAEVIPPAPVCDEKTRK